jgi:hypothetical protein
MASEFRDGAMCHALAKERARIGAPEPGLLFTPMRLFISACRRVAGMEGRSFQGLPTGNDGQDGEIAP